MLIDCIVKIYYFWAAVPLQQLMAAGALPLAPSPPSTLSLKNAARYIYKIQIYSYRCSGLRQRQREGEGD